MALSIGTGIVQNGLICHLDAANIRSYPGYFTTWFDLSETRNNVTLSGTTFTTSNSGSINFDGVDNLAGFALNPSVTNQITISLWIKPSNNTGISWILGREGAYRMLYTSTLFIWDCSTDNNGWYTSGTNLVSSPMSVYDKWRHVVGTYDGSNLRLYIDGILHATGANISGNIATVGNNIILMKSFVAGLTSGKGSIGQIQFYNRALSASEILQNYNSTKQRYIYNQPIINNGLMVGLDFSDPLTYTGIGNTVFDLSVNTYRGTLTNGPKFTNDKNGGIVFDGVDDSIDFRSNLTNIVYNNFSFEFVAKPNATITASAESTSGIGGATGKRYIFEPFNEGSNGGFGIALGTNAIECIEHGGSYLPVLLSHSANLSDINHYCVVVNDKKSRLYINGVLIKEGLQSPRPFSVIRNIASLGSMYYGSYSGTIYEFNSYSRVLSANEIRSIFEQNRGKYGIKNDRDKSGLILDLDFSNRACYPGTGTSAQDLSGFGYRANLNNSPTFSRDQRGNFQFTGSQFLTIPTSGPLILTKNDNYSLNFWVYTNSTQAQNGPSILEYADGNSYAFAIRFGISNSTIQAKAYDGVNPINPSCDVTFVFNKWNHICAVYNWSKNMIEVYMNGKLGNRLNLESYTFGSINNTSDIGIATRANFSGRIAELKIYKRALNSTEINDYYLSTKDRFFTDREDIRDGLILDLDANNYDSYPGGNTWFDTSGSGLTTILSNSPSFIRGTASKIFFGSGSYGSVPYTITSSPVTIFAWFNSRSFSSASNLGALISNYDNTTNGFDIRKQSAALQLSLVTDVTVGNINFIDTVADNTWYNIAFTYNGSSLISYTNGMQFSSTALTGTRRNGPRIALATSAYDFPNRVYASDISQFRVYNRTLSASEVNTLFQNTRSRYGI